MQRESEVLDMDTLSARERYRVLTGLVIPRPIAWVSTVSDEGVRNLAPHSFFNIVSADPPIVQFTSTGVKDSFRNAARAGQFVLNLVTEDLASQMNVTAAALSSSEDEFQWAELEWTDSDLVRPPRVARTAAGFECGVRTTLEMGAGRMVFGDVLRAHVLRAIWKDLRVNYEKLRPVGRLGGPYYQTVDAPWAMKRLGIDDLRSPDLDEPMEDSQPRAGTCLP